MTLDTCSGCGVLDIASREWLVTNGVGSYASGTTSGLLTRRYHGLLVAALKPPLGRTLLLTKLDETALYDGHSYPLYANRWASGAVDPHGYRYIERFYLDGTMPVWRFACADALLEKRIWMQPGVNTTYIRYTLCRASRSLTLAIKALVNYRGFHGSTQAGNWRMKIDSTEGGICVTAFTGAVPLYLLTDRSNVSLAHDWYYGFELAQERYRGLNDCEDHLHAATFNRTLQPGESLTLVASTEPNPNLEGAVALDIRRAYEQTLIQLWQANGNSSGKVPVWIQHLALAADQFIVSRSLVNQPDGKTIIAGYHWFGDWGRDTMISLPGLTIPTGRPEVARPILRTFARYVNQGMLPNCFPDEGKPPMYNTVDATLWYFEAIRAYYTATGDDQLLSQLFPVLANIIDWHCRGTRYNIRLDLSDGLLYAGEAGVQLTWMDAKIGDWVVTPRIGKPIEVNALWYNALRVMVHFAQNLGKADQKYKQMAEQTAVGFGRFWNPTMGYCYDVLDGPDGHDASLRPNQIFAVSLPVLGAQHVAPLLTPEQRRAIVDVCSRTLLTPHGLRSLSPDCSQYRGCYGGDQGQRDSAYHQGTVWGWLLGPFVVAHLHVFNDPTQAQTFLEPMASHLCVHGLGSLSEIFDGDPPMTPRGCIAQAWTVAEVLRAWAAIEDYAAKNARGDGVS